MTASATPDALTPYDTGERLEPQLWPVNDDPDRYGRVDFDDEEGATVLSIHVEKQPNGTFTLHVRRVSEVALELKLDGEIGGQMPTTASTEVDTPLDVRCPACGALPSVPCTVPVRIVEGTYRQQVPNFHESRVVAANKPQKNGAITT